MSTPMDVTLRTFVFIDSLQPQLASYLATSSQGFLPVPGDACMWIEVAPGMAAGGGTAGLSAAGGAIDADLEGNDNFDVPAFLRRQEG